jgi:UDP-N-acetylglucosamine--N-acetylmuramyl-(pentapeptide) pyrophosphoryl-undecaprenol N-acetylglucosamine transferase
MKILFTGGGTGGHFYPIIAVAQEIKKLTEERRLVEPKLYFMSVDPYNERILFENGIEFVSARAGKLRRHFSFKNFTDIFVTAFGLLEALWKMYAIYPDIVFGKGGFASFPALFAARILNIPVFIHESDSHPGRTNIWAAKFAKRIALSYPEAQKYFPEEKSAITGNPLRKEVLYPIKEGAHEYLKLNPNVPIIFVVGGSQGSTKINDTVVDDLPDLLERYQIIHQAGKNNINDIRARTSVILKDSPLASRYLPYDYLNDTAIRMVAGAASLVITRAGSTLFEIAHWGLPAIIIPIPEAISHDQRTNALTYSQSGAAIVIEEHNLTPTILRSEIDRLMSNKTLLEDMRQATKKFARPEAGALIATEILNIALQHEE